jgi:hypothetical protein
MRRPFDKPAVFSKIPEYIRLPLGVLKTREKSRVFSRHEILSSTRSSASTLCPLVRRGFPDASGAAESPTAGYGCFPGFERVRHPHREEGNMKWGFRKPSLRKRIAARTSFKRYVRHSLGFKAPRGWGWLTNPKKAAYNRVYYRTTFGLNDLFRSRRRRRASSGCLLMIAAALAGAALAGIAIR